MKKLIAIIFLLATSALAQDVILGTGVRYGVLTGQPAVSVSGTSVGRWNTINVNFVIPNIFPDGGICFAFVNGDNISHTATLTAFVTENSGITAFAGNSQNWNQVPISPPSAANSYSFPATATTQIWVRTPGAFRTTLVISGGTGNGLVRIDYTQSTQSCGAINQWSVFDAPAAASPCNTSSAVIAGVAGVRHVANCVSVAIANVAGTTGEAVAFDIRDGGAAGNCTTGTVRWTTIITNTTSAGTGSAIAVCGLNISGAAGNALQVCAEVTPGTGDACKTSMSGFDQ